MSYIKLPDISGALLLIVCLDRGTHHWVPRSQRLFGGQIVGQALVAAAKSVTDDLYAHSLHCYFVRPGKEKKKIDTKLILFFNITINLRITCKHWCSTSWHMHFIPCT